MCRNSVTLSSRSFSCWLLLESALLEVLGNLSGGVLLLGTAVDLWLLGLGSLVVSSIGLGFQAIDLILCLLYVLSLC